MFISRFLYNLSDADDFLVIFIFMILIFISLFILDYVLNAVALSSFAKNNGFEDKAFLAWIPVARNYLFAYMGGDANIFNSIYLRADGFAILYMLIGYISLVPFIRFFSWIIVIIVKVYAYNNLFKKIDFKNATLFTVLSIFIPFFRTICLFINRNALFDDEFFNFDDEDI